jgi:hypothetical protein
MSFNVIDIDSRASVYSGWRETAFSNRSTACR